MSDDKHSAENDAAAVLRDVLDALDRIERFDVPQGGDYGVASADAVVAIRNVIPPDRPHPPTRPRARLSMAEMSGGQPAEKGLHPCVGCGVELDADDRHDRCEDCEQPPARVVPPAASECPSRCGRNEPCPDPWHDRRVIPSADPICNERGIPESECPAHCRHTRVIPPGSTGGQHD